MPRGGQKKWSEKSGQKTVERVLQLVKESPRITQTELVAELNISRSTVQKHLANLKASGRLRRIGPDKVGHWEVIGV